GDSTYGQLGIGRSTPVGDIANQMGDLLPVVQVGTKNDASSTPKKVSQISAGLYVTCAILDTAETKCWGLNSVGQLGQQDTHPRGLSVNDMNEALKAIRLGTG